MPFRPVDRNLKPVLVYIDASVRQRLKIKAAVLGTTITDLVRRALAHEVRDVEAPRSTTRQRNGNRR